MVKMNMFMLCVFIYAPPPKSPMTSRWCITTQTNKKGTHTHFKYSSTIHRQSYIEKKKKDITYPTLVLTYEVF